MPINGLPAAEALGSCSPGPPRSPAKCEVELRRSNYSSRPAGRRGGAPCGAGRLCDGGRFVIEGEGCGSPSWARLRWRPKGAGPGQLPRYMRGAAGRSCRGAGAWGPGVRLGRALRAVSVGEGGRWARRLGSAEERGCAHLPTVNLCGDPFVPPPLPGTNQPDPSRLLRLARRCCCRKFNGEC